MKTTLSLRLRSICKFGEVAMFYASCPTAVVDAPAAVVWALLMEPAGWGNVFDVRVASVGPPGPATIGQKVCGETGPQFLHLKLEFRMIEIAKLTAFQR
jgi:hypothetical protein